MFKAELLERAARFRSTEEDPTRNLQSCPSLVLNADYTPLSYYPLSLWPWQTAIKAIFLDRVDVIETYDREVHSPSLDMKIPSVIALKQYVKPSEFPAFTRFNVFLRDRFSCQFCGAMNNLTFDHVVPRRLAGRPRGRTSPRACAPCNMKKAAAPRNRRGCSCTANRSVRRTGSCSSTARCSRPTISTKRGATGCTGTSNWKPRRSGRDLANGRYCSIIAGASPICGLHCFGREPAIAPQLRIIAARNHSAARCDGAFVRVEDIGEVAEIVARHRDDAIALRDPRAAAVLAPAHGIVAAQEQRFEMHGRAAPAASSAATVPAAFCVLRLVLKITVMPASRRRRMPVTAPGTGGAIPAPSAVPMVPIRRDRTACRSAPASIRSRC